MLLDIIKKNWKSNPIKIKSLKTTSDLFYLIEMIEYHFYDDIIDFNELVYFKQMYHKLYKPDKYFSYKIVYNKKNCGVICGVKIKNTFFIDYLVIVNEYRKYSFEIFKELKDIFGYCNIIVEVKSEQLCRLYRRLGFKIHTEKYEYFNFDINLFDGVVSIKHGYSNLLYFSKDIIPFKENLEITYTHYRRWFKIYGYDKTKEYNELLDKVLSKYN